MDMNKIQGILERARMFMRENGDVRRLLVSVTRTDEGMIGTVYVTDPTEKTISLGITDGSISGFVEEVD